MRAYLPDERGGFWEICTTPGFILAANIQKVNYDEAYSSLSGGVGLYGRPFTKRAGSRRLHIDAVLHQQHLQRDDRVASDRVDVRRHGAGAKVSRPEFE